MGYSEILVELEELTEESIKRKEGDYVQDGILYCGKCHTPKQTVITFGGKELKPMCLCKCAEKELEKAEEEYKERQRQYRIEENRKECFFGSDLIGCTFDKDDKENSKASSVARNYVEQFSQMHEKGLIFYGSVGTGKTFIACCIANALIDKGYRCLVTNFSRLVNTIQDLYGNRQEYIDSLNRYDLLIIDDLAAERDTEYMNEIVQTIIDNRYRAKKPVIITTNLTRDELMNPADIIRQRTYSRLIEVCIPFEFVGKNRRKSIAVKDYSYYKEKLGL